jgi:hypothetical protein
MTRVGTHKRRGGRELPCGYGAPNHRHTGVEPLPCGMTLLTVLVHFATYLIGSVLDLSGSIRLVGSALAGAIARFLYIHLYLGIIVCLCWWTRTREPHEVTNTFPANIEAPMEEWLKSAQRCMYWWFGTERCTVSASQHPQGSPAAFTP